MATNNALNNTSNPFTVGNLSLATNTLSSSTGNIILAPVSGSSVAVTAAPLTVGNLSLATNTLSSSTGNIILAPVSGSSVAVTAAPLTVGNLSLATNTLSSSTGNIVLDPAIGGSVSINSSYTLPNAIGSNGQVLASNGAGGVTFQTPSAASIYPWTKIDDGTTAVTMTVNNGYINENSSANVTFTLPTLAAVGDTFQVLNASSANNFIIKCGAAQEMYVGNQPGPVVGAGAITSTALGDWIEIICLNVNSSFLSCVKQGNLDVQET